MASTSRPLAPAASKRTLAIGTIFAQGLFALATLHISTMVGPAHFGVFTHILSISLLCGAIGAAKLEHTLLLVAEPLVSDFYRLGLRTIAIIAGVLLFATAIIILTCSQPTYLLLVPPLGAAIALYQMTNVAQLRAAQYRSLGINRVCRSLAFYLIAVALLQVHPAHALSIGLFISYLVGTGMGLSSLPIEPLKRGLPPPDEISKYRPLCQKLVPGALLDQLAIQMLGIWIPNYYGHTTAGHFGLASRIAFMPAAAVGQGLADSYRSGLGHLVRTQQSSRPHWKRWASRLTALALAFACALLALSHFWPRLSPKEWMEAGILLPAMIPYVIGNIIANPLSQSLVLTRHEHLLLRWQASSAVAAVAVVSWCQLTAASMFNSLLIYSSTCFFMYALMVALTFVATRSSDSRLISNDKTTTISESH